MTRAGEGEASWGGEVLGLVSKGESGEEGEKGEKDIALTIY